jgi:hypothetical protein
MPSTLTEPPARKETARERVTRRMEAARSCLAQQGWIIPKRGGRPNECCLRYIDRTVTGPAVERSISLGSDSDLIEYARQLLRQFRGDSDLVRETAALVRLARTMKDLALHGPTVGP